MSYVSEALETQINTYISLKRMYDTHPNGLKVTRAERNQWLTDLHALGKAKPFYWNKRTTEIVAALSEDFVLDEIECARELMYCDVGWMWFGEAPPFMVELFVRFPDGNRRLSAPLRAISWYVFGHDGAPYLGITGWSQKAFDSASGQWVGSLTPSIWSSTLLGKRMSEDIPASELNFKGITDETSETETRKLKQFVVAAQTFIRQDFVSLYTAPIERAARKRLDRAGVTKHADSVQVVYLRRIAPREASNGGTGEAREWSCQWTVAGHVRQQWYRSLQMHLPVYIHPYLKGPEDKPLKKRSTPIFAVTR